MTECGPTRESKPLAALWRLGCFVRAAIHPAVAGRDSPRIGVRHETTAKTSPELGATGRPPVSTGTAAPPLGRGKPTPSWRNRPNPPEHPKPHDTDLHRRPLKDTRLQGNYIVFVHVRCALLTEENGLDTQFQQRTAARLNPPVHQIRA